VVLASSCPQLSHLVEAGKRIRLKADGSSDVNVMLHVNRVGGLTIAVSENEHVTQIASRTVLSDDAIGVLVPILEAIAGWDSTQIRTFFDSRGFLVREWAKVQTDSLTIALAAQAAA
jgi:hypothetical protein